MNLEELRAVQIEERGADSLQPLSDSFYRDVAAYIEDLRAERERAAERSDNPFDSDEVRRLTDEIETAEEVVEAVYERRVGKVVKRASLAAAGMSVDDAGLTDEEATLFADLVDLIEANRGEVLAAFDAESSPDAGADDGPAPDPRPDDPASSVEPPATGDRDDATGFDAGEAMGDPPEPSPDGPPADGPEPSSEPSADAAADEGNDGDDRDVGGDGGDDADDGDRLTVRITRDVGEIFGVDERVYDLGEEDVVTLPAANAKPLLDRDAARRLD